MKARYIIGWLAIALCALIGTAAGMISGSLNMHDAVDRFAQGLAWASIGYWMAVVIHCGPTR